MHAQLKNLQSTAVCSCLQIMLLLRLLLLLQSRSPLALAVNCIAVCCIANALLCSERAVQRGPTNLQYSNTQN
jgi:hypothetical protein